MSGKVLKIRGVGDPILSEICDSIDISNGPQAIKEVLDDLKATFAYVGGFGIAAPQIGEKLKIIIIEVDKKKCKYKGVEDIPATVMINPVIEIINPDATNEEHEGCHSIPIVRCKVTRYNEIKVSFYDENFIKQEWQVKDYTARLIQHEYDHLDGLIFLQRVTDLNSFSTAENLNRFPAAE